MEELDKKTLSEFSEEELFSSEVICGEADLLYLDSYLKELFHSARELRNGDQAGV
jgi:hypothetical protein